MRLGQQRNEEGGLAGILRVAAGQGPSFSRFLLAFSVAANIAPAVMQITPFDISLCMCPDSYIRPSLYQRLSSLSRLLAQHVFVIYDALTNFLGLKSCV